MTVITTINGNDQISSSRVTINTNFLNLNAGKAENVSPTIGGTTTFNGEVDINGTIKQNSAYSKFGASTPNNTLGPTLSTCLEVWGTDNNPSATGGGIQVGVGNTSNGVNAFSGYFLNNDLASDNLSDNYAFLGLNSSTYSNNFGGSATAFAIPSALILENTMGPVTFMSSLNNVSGYINFIVAGEQTTNEVMRIDNNGLLQVGYSGHALGQVAFLGSTSGSTTLQPLVAATGTLTLPSATDTLIGKATTDVLTNKTYDTAGTGNVFKINGTSITAVNGTGAVSLTNSPAFTGTPTGVTQVSSDNSTALATDAFVQAVTELSMATVPLNLGSGGGGTYSFASNGSGCILVVTASGGTVTNTLTIANAGSGYKVGDLLILIQAGSNYDAIFRVLTLSGSGVASVAVLYGGTGYVTGGGVTSTSQTSVHFSYTLTGTLTSAATFVMTNGTYLTQSNQWSINNNTTGAYTTTFKISNGSDTAIGTGVVIPQGTNNSASTLIETDGVNDIWYSTGYLGTPTATTINGVTIPSATDTTALLGTAQTFTATNTFKQIINSNNPITASGNAATVPITYRLNTVTNNSAATLTITMTTTSAVDGLLSMVRVLDASGAAQTITWVNTESSNTSVPTTSNGSTTLPLTVGFQYNGGTSKWRCIASS